MKSKCVFLSPHITPNGSNNVTESHQNAEEDGACISPRCCYTVSPLQRCLFCSGLVTPQQLRSNLLTLSSVPKATLAKSSQLAASQFFGAVFGSQNSSRALNFLITLSAFGNIIAGAIGSSRIIRECGRQGVLPWPRLWASTRPFGTPLAPFALKWGLTVLMILAPPAGDAFNFIVDLESYPANVFFSLTTTGLLLIRRRRSRLGIPPTEFRVWAVAIIFSLAVNVFILAMPWYPPPGGRDGGDVTFWYATYCVTGLGM
jgi:amino acid transporter